MRLGADRAFGANTSSCSLRHNSLTGPPARTRRPPASSSHYKCRLWRWPRPLAALTGRRYVRDHSCSNVDDHNMSGHYAFTGRPSFALPPPRLSEDISHPSRVLSASYPLPFLSCRCGLASPLLLLSFPRPILLNIRAPRAALVSLRYGHVRSLCLSLLVALRPLRRASCAAAPWRGPGSGICGGESERCERGAPGPSDLVLSFDLRC